MRRRLFLMVTLPLSRGLDDMHAIGPCAGHGGRSLKRE